MSRTVLVVRLDADGDVLLAGPAVRAVAADRGTRVVLLVGPRGRQAAELLPGVSRVLVWAAPWIEPTSVPVTGESCDRLIRLVRSERVEEAVVLTSFHQSPLPTALLLRLAGVGRITAVSEDFPGSLLDVRVPDPGDVPEALRALETVRAAGFTATGPAATTLAVRRPLPDVRELTGPPGYVVLHPGTSVPARAWPAPRWAELAVALRGEGHRVVVTGTAEERALVTRVVGRRTDIVDLCGRTTWAQLGGVLADASALVVANTGPAHLAAAVGTPVVSLFAPTVPAERWAPLGVPVVVLGDQDGPCKDTRVTRCPFPGHPCLSSVSPGEVLDALADLQERAA